MGKLRFVLPITLTVIIFVGLLLPEAQAGSGTTLSSYATTPPSIDGNIQAAEWTSADILSFGPFGSGNGYSGTIYMMNDGANLYIGVILNGDDDLTADDNARFFFDNDHGAEATPEQGDDDLIADGLSAVLGDLFYSSGTGNWDNLNGGTTDGQAASSRQGSSNMFELSHPLNDADDAHDFSLSIGDTVGFSFTTVVDGNWYTNILGVGNYLNPSTYCNYVVNSLSNPDLVISPHVIDVSVGNTFTVDVSIENIPDGLVMKRFEFGVYWNPAMMELASHDDIVEVGEEESRPWDTYYSNPPWDGSLECYGEGGGWSTDAVWFTLTFHCIAEGSSTIVVSDFPNGGTVWLWEGETPQFGGPFDGDQNIINQHAPAPPSGPSGYVGGEFFTANKAVVVAPYIMALISVVAIAAVIVKRRRD